MYVQLHDTLHSHPKIIKLSRALNVWKSTAIGCMTSLWSWAILHAADGDLRQYDIDDIEIAAGWEGERGAFVSAAISVRLLDSIDGHCVIHDWIDYCDKLKAAERQRAKRERDKSQNVTSCHAVSQSVTPCHAPSHDVTPEQEHEQEHEQEESTTCASSDLQLLSAIGSEPVDSSPKSKPACSKTPPPELADLPLYAADAKLCRRWPELLAAWQQGYPGVDVVAEIVKAHTWEVTNPERRKKNRPAFLVRWLAHAQDAPKAQMQPQKTAEDYLRYTNVKSIA